MGNPLSGALNVFSGLPDAIKAGGPVAVILAFALFAGYQGWWGFWGADTTLQGQFAHQCDDLRTERDLYRGIALKGVVSTEELAKASIQKIEAVSPDRATRKAAGHPAPVAMRTQPVTQSEKVAVEKPPQATDPKTLAIRQDNAITVVRKTVPANASIQPAKKN